MISSRCFGGLDAGSNEELNRRIVFLLKIPGCTSLGFVMFVELDNFEPFPLVFFLVAEAGLHRSPVITIHEGERGRINASSSHVNVLDSIFEDYAAVLQLEG